MGRPWQPRCPKCGRKHWDRVSCNTPRAGYGSREPNVSQVLSEPSNKGPSQIRIEGEGTG